MQLHTRLSKHHGHMYREGQLDKQVKEAFFTGLRSEYQSLVSHMKDDPFKSNLDLFSSVRECEENEENSRRSRRADNACAYPAAVSQAPPAQAQGNGNGGYQAHRAGNRYAPRTNRNAVPVKAMQMDQEFEDPETYPLQAIEYGDEEVQNGEDLELELLTNFYVAEVQLADDTERRQGKCYNCSELPQTGAHVAQLPSSVKGGVPHLPGKDAAASGPVKLQRGPWKPGRLCPPSAPAGDTASTGSPSTVNKLITPPYWNKDPHACWFGPENVGYAHIDGCRELVLIDSGARANAVTPEYAKKHHLHVRPVEKLAGHPTTIPIAGVGGTTTALGYVIIHVCIEGIASYQEEQCVLVIPDLMGLGRRVPVILGTPTICRLC